MRKIIEGFKTVDARCALVLVYMAAALTVLEYYYLPPRIQARLGPLGRISLEAGITWAIATSVAFGLIPLLIVKFVHREPLSSVGYNARGFWKHSWIYFGLFLFMVPFLFYAASQPAFVRTYPFVGAARNDFATFWKWEAAYILQFFALESFFRGYALFTLEKKIGQLAIFVLAVPYCMIHYHKPWMEAGGAIIAGIALCALALRTKSFYGGAMLHMLVAVTMDTLGARAGGLFD